MGFTNKITTIFGTTQQKSCLGIVFCVRCDFTLLGLCIDL